MGLRRRPANPVENGNTAVPGQIVGLGGAAGSGLEYMS
jgi:hypothetical protein